MIDFLKSAFRGLFTFSIVVCMIAVVILGITMFGNSVVIGILVIVGGLIAIIISAGMTATILNIDDNLEIIANNISKLNSSSNNAQSNYLSSGTGNRTIVGNRLQKKCTRCKKEIDEDYSACPHCGNNKFE